ncbi:MAG TPA: DUF5362 family protein [Chitinophagaceae bacterium]|nr:DUF5362 family protein [Chitinophagaceae bacterium]
MEPNQTTSLFQLNVDANNAYALRSAASWGKVLGVVSIIMGILLVITGILVQSAANDISSDFSGYRGRTYDSGALGRAGLIVYGIAGVIMLLSGVFALNFGNRASKALRTNDTQALASGFSAARNYFAVWAIIMIVLLLLVLIGIIGGATGSGGGRF